MRNGEAVSYYVGGGAMIVFAVGSNKTKKRNFLTPLNTVV
jgi:hypothetical protein